MAENTSKREVTAADKMTVVLDYCPDHPLNIFAGIDTETLPLISVCIIAFKSNNTIYETIDSVLIQDYPHVELMISDDSSPNFDEAKIKEYIQQNKMGNIVSLLVYHHAENQGTVKNIEFARTHANGEFMIFMAADDALFDSTALSQYVNAFQKGGEATHMVCSLTAMCGAELSDIRHFAPNKECVELICEKTPQEIFSYSAHTFVFPTTSSCYRKSLFEKIGGYDTENYVLIEDASLFVRMLRAGIKPLWIPNMIGARHRDGGVSHNKSHAVTETQRLYWKDTLQLYALEYIPYKKIISRKDRPEFLEKYRWTKYYYDSLFIYPNLSASQKILYRIKNIPAIMKNLLLRFGNQWNLWMYNKELQRLVLRVAATSAILYLALFFIIGMQKTFWLLLLLQWLALIAAGLFLVQMLYQLLHAVVHSILIVATGRDLWAEKRERKRNKHARGE